jgi:hypothetical protein
MTNHIYKTRKVLAALAILVIAGSLSCKKLIQIPPNPSNQISQGSVFSDSADIISAVVGIYANFDVSGGSANIFSGTLTENMGCAADEFIYSLGNTFQTNTYVATDGTVGTFWSSAYANLYQINTCLAGIASTNAISDSLKQLLTGELEVDRALHYFYLVNLFGGVPLVTGQNYQTNAVLPRSSVDSVYDLIISDLTAARNVLTPNYPSVGSARPNLYTADALLARVYLYRNQYAAADAMASEIINSGLYSLVPLNSVFLSGSNEAIWQLPAVGITYQTMEGESFIPFLPGFEPYYQLQSGLLNSFEAGDQRATSWIGTSTVGSTNYYYPYKYENRMATATPVEGYVVFRLGEQYLIRAEALAQQNKLDSALSDLNMIRQRAGLGNSTAVTGADVLNAVMHERQTELFAEWGHRWFDLRRTGAIDSVLGALKPGWQPTDSTLPVPFTQLQNNPFLTQNPGY